MILEFSVSNYKSIKDLQTISFVAAPIVSKYKELDDNNVFKASEKELLLKVVGIYGANGSGKSNLVKAMQAMLLFVYRLPSFFWPRFLLFPTTTICLFR